MSVIKGRKIIFCEGKKSSLDYQLLPKILENISGDRPTIVPTGGKFTFSVFAQGYFFREDLENQHYLVFRDRDFDVEPTANVQLLQLNTRLGRKFMFLTHRACIENYLLEPNLIHEYWTAKYVEKQENPSSRWGHGNSPGIQAIAAWIENAARSLLYYQAVRWALADLLRLSAVRSQLKTTWTGGSGKLPSSLTRQNCNNEAIKLVNQFLQAVDTVTQERFTEQLNIYCDRFAQDEFWQQQQYTIWFHGKDLQKAMQIKQPQYISLKSFYNWAISHFEIAQYPDIIELRTKIEKL
ncbi:DUF4435 domain-containing protein [Oscillatoria salina]|uniref:DUF4435 domain-containing protein n=1 Tax=Oscillatoria salina TaxID=331517 RepID=UPI0013B85F08|nr:DUF4435 domain-containing protein [Oscillatoria salina]MBZ8181639.1 DUF4435 domain-containing protein [Oscillatoria salina IIICB1]NET88678.1 DUF4435 domain-containing protein [Kamptonema sp. SIO1D9]